MNEDSHWTNPPYPLKPSDAEVKIYKENLIAGRTLQTLNKNVIGRVRNMMKLPDGSSVWPLFGSNTIRNVCDTIKRFQCVQESYTDVTLKIQGTIPEDKYEEIKALVRNRLQHPFNINIQVIDNFPDGKFEEFVCKI